MVTSLTNVIFDQQGSCGFHVMTATTLLTALIGTLLTAGLSDGQYGAGRQAPLDRRLKALEVIEKALASWGGCRPL